MDARLIKAIVSLIRDVEGMQSPGIAENTWFGPFSEFDTTDENAVVEWPNLAISLENVKKVIAELEAEKPKPVEPAVTFPHWHAVNPWADRVIYVDLDDLLECLTPGYSRHRLMSMYGPHLDAYLLLDPSSHISAGVRYGPEGNNYLSPMVHQARARELLNKALEKLDQAHRARLAPKTTVIKDLATERGWKYADVPMNEIDPADARGLPVVRADEYEPNFYRIIDNRNWIARIQFNGEFMASKQEEMAQRMAKSIQP